MYLYAFIVLCIIAGSVVAFYYLGESATKLEDNEPLSKLKICPSNCQKGSKDPKCQNCIPLDEAIDRTPEPIMEEEMTPEPTLEPNYPMTPEIKYDERKEYEMNQRIKIIEEVKSENEYIRRLNERIDEINKEIKN